MIRLEQLREAIEVPRQHQRGRGVLIGRPIRRVLCEQLSQYVDVPHGVRLEHDAPPVANLLVLGQIGVRLQASQVPSRRRAPERDLRESFEIDPCGLHVAFDQIDRRQSVEQQGTFPIDLGGHDQRILRLIDQAQVQAHVALLPERLGPPVRQQQRLGLLRKAEQIITQPVQTTQGAIHRMAHLVVIRTPASQIEQRFPHLVARVVVSLENGLPHRHATEQRERDSDTRKRQCRNIPPDLARSGFAEDPGNRALAEKR